MKLQFMRMFGPVIAKVIIPDEIVKELNDACDGIVKSKKKIKSSDVSDRLAGHVTHELRIPQSVISSQSNFWNSLLGQYIESVENHVDLTMLRRRPDTSIDLQGAWFNRYFAGDNNPAHTHPEATISMTGFLKVPNWDLELSKIKKNKKYTPSPGNLEFVHGNIQEWSSYKFSVKPVVGDLYIFPSTLTHVVYPFKSSGERRSFAMNFGDNFWR